MSVTIWSPGTKDTADWRSALQINNRLLSYRERKMNSYFAVHLHEDPDGSLPNEMWVRVQAKDPLAAISEAIRIENMHRIVPAYQVLCMCRTARRPTTMAPQCASKNTNWRQQNEQARSKTQPNQS